MKPRAVAAKRAGAWFRLGRRLAAVAGAWLLATRLFGAGVTEESFEAANRLYEQGNFAGAATAYEQMVGAASVPSALLFNLGNAWYKSGNLGRAIASYREAERAAPRDPELRANLQFVRNQVQGPTLPPERWQRWLGRLTLNEWTLLAAAAFWLWLVLLILLQWRPAWKRALRNLVLAAGAATGLLVLGLAAVLHSGHSVRAAVVAAPSAVVHNGPLDESPSAFTLHDGAEVAVLDRKDEWLQITAGKGRNGWIRRDLVVMPRL